VLLLEKSWKICRVLGAPPSDPVGLRRAGESASSPPTIYNCEFCADFATIHSKDNFNKKKIFVLVLPSLWLCPSTLADLAKTLLDVKSLRNLLTKATCQWEQTRTKAINNSIWIYQLMRYSKNVFIFTHVCICLIYGWVSHTRNLLGSQPYKDKSF